MIAEIRTYTAKPGMLEDMIATLNDMSFPNQRACGIDILGMWVDRANNQVVWIRSFASMEDKQSRLATYEGSEIRSLCSTRCGR